MSKQKVNSLKSGKIFGILGILSYVVASVFCLISAFEMTGSEYASMRVGMFFLFMIVLIGILIFTLLVNRHIIFDFLSLLFNAIGAFIYFKTVNDANVKLFTMIGVALNALGIIIGIIYHSTKNSSYYRSLYKNDNVYKKIMRKLRFRKVLNILLNLIIVYLSILPWSVFLKFEKINPIYLLFINNVNRYEISFGLSWLICGILVYIIKRGNPVDSIVTFKNTTITEEYELRDFGFLTESYDVVKTGEKKKDEYHDVVLLKGGFILYVLLFILVGVFNIIGLIVSVFAPAKYRKIYPCVGIPKGKTLPADFVLHTGGFAVFVQFWFGFLIIDGDYYFDYLYDLYS